VAILLLLLGVQHLPWSSGIYHGESATAPCDCSRIAGETIQDLSGLGSNEWFTEIKMPFFNLALFGYFAAWK
jgi:hypothetical protein